jgi:hypothetical protein
MRGEYHDTLATVGNKSGSLEGLTSIYVKREDEASFRESLVGGSRCLNHGKKIHSPSSVREFGTQTWTKSLAGGTVCIDYTPRSTDTRHTTRMRKRTSDVSRHSPVLRAKFVSTTLRTEDARHAYSKHPIVTHAYSKAPTL